MDALARVVTVAAPLLTQVDDALTTLGAPADHRVWAALRRVGATPFDAVAFFAGTDPDAVRAAADRARAWAADYTETRLTGDVRWGGAAGREFTVAVAALTDHLLGPGAGRPSGADRPPSETLSMVGRLRLTADFGDAIADWYSGARADLAVAVVEAMGSRQALTLRAAELSGEVGQVSATMVLAAADLGAHVLAAAEAALATGDELVHRWRGRLDEHPFRSPAGEQPVGGHHTIDLRG